MTHARPRLLLADRTLGTLPAAFDYERETRRHYQDDGVAAAYHDAFTTAGGWLGLRTRTVAERERAVVSAMLGRVPHATVLDVPAGSGKLAPVMKALGARVTACDISPNMLALAGREYAAAGLDDARLVVGDAEHLRAFVSGRFEAAVCLRLMHRVPPHVRRNILRELAAAAEHTIITYGAETPVHAVRRRLRGRLMGGNTRPLCYASPAEIVAEVSERFEVLERAWIVPWLSQEIALLLRPRRT